MSQHEQRHQPIQQPPATNTTLQKWVTDVLKHKHIFPLPLTHIQGSKTIYTTFVSTELINSVNAEWIVFGSGIGNHIITYINICIQSLIKKDHKDIARRQAQCLQRDHLGSIRAYVKTCKKSWRMPWLLSELTCSSNRSTRPPTPRKLT